MRTKDTGDHPPQTVQRDGYTVEYRFNWTGKVNRNLRSFKRMRRRPCNLLEIGVFEGRTAEWFLTNLLVHPGSRYTGVDPWIGLKAPGDGNLIEPEGMEARARANLSHWGDKAQLIRADSVEWLKNDPVPDEHYDFVYVDGNHQMASALTDIVLVWSKLKIGGILVVDDYTKWSVRLAVNAFLYAYEGMYELVFHKRRQVAVRKITTELSPPRPAGGILRRDRLKGIAG